MKRKSTTSRIAWIGHKSYIQSPEHTIYNSRRKAKLAGWDNPSKVRITLLRITPEKKERVG